MKGNYVVHLLYDLGNRYSAFSRTSNASKNDGTRDTLSTFFIMGNTHNVGFILFI
jgi:hypothetical protein